MTVAEAEKQLFAEQGIHAGNVVNIPPTEIDKNKFVEINGHVQVSQQISIGGRAATDAKLPA